MSGSPCGDLVLHAALTGLALGAWLVVLVTHILYKIYNGERRG